MRIVAGETHSCCHDSAHSQSRDSAGPGEEALEAPKHQDGHSDPPAARPAVEKNQEAPPWSPEF